jgi:hypothetical protein
MRAESKKLQTSNSKLQRNFKPQASIGMPIGFCSNVMHAACALRLVASLEFEV